MNNKAARTSLARILYNLIVLCHYLTDTESLLHSHLQETVLSFARSLYLLTYICALWGIIE